MPSTARSHGSFRLSARILVVGLWTVLFGMFLLLFAVQLFATLSSASAVGVLGQETGTGVDVILYDSLLLLYRGGFLTLGAGGLLMAFGGLFIISVSR